MIELLQSVLHILKSAESLESTWDGKIYTAVTFAESEVCIVCHQVTVSPQSLGSKAVLSIILLLFYY